MIGQRIPHSREPRAFKVLYVSRREIRDAEGLEAEGHTKIVDAAAGEIGRSGGFPQRRVKFAAARRKAEDAPAGGLAITLDDGDGLRWAERGVEHGRIAEVQIDLTENELAEGHVIALRQGFEKGPDLLPPCHDGGLTEIAADRRGIRSD